MRALIIADSPASDIKLEYQRDIDITICLDGAAAKIPNEIHIDYILGDFDTINRDQIDISHLNAAHVVMPNQDSTDLEKGIEYAISLGAISICVINAFGGRADHSLYNIALLKKYARKAYDIYMINGAEKMYYISNTSGKLLGQTGSHIAIMPFPAAAISSQGLSYDMQDFQIELGISASVSNSLRKEMAHIEISGAAIVICDISTDLQMLERMNAICS